MPYIDIRLNFETEVDDDYDYTNYNLVSVQQASTDIPEEDLRGVAEWAAQSDTWHVDAHNAISTALYDIDEQEIYGD